MADDIAKHRAEIDALDEKIAALLNARAARAAAIGKLKANGGAYRPEREAEVLRRIAGANRGPLANEALVRLFTEIISACRSLEEPLSVAYLGPQGTFSEMALAKQFGAAVAAQPCGSIDEVFRAAETGAAHYAVVPVENSTDGAIGRTLDLLLATPLKICAEVVLRVQQNLLAKGASMKGIRKVYSHPQSLAQCHGWLAQHLPGAQRVPQASNAEAARMAAKEKSAAAIGPEIAAERYKLKVLARAIEDDPRNRTRFLVLGSHDAGPSGKDRTSLVMTTHNRPGSLHELIASFSTHGVNMSRLESRPARTGQWEYYFYIDLEGHQQDEKLAKAVAELRDKAPFVKVFGSYPAAVL
ncbi:MAG: prephenate dehydratase [Betaproteobacteria bacterium]|nr:MAG: prephenate dehydratase [Betaproteobacteria bacterium]